MRQVNDVQGCTDSELHRYKIFYNLLKVSGNGIVTELALNQALRRKKASEGSRNVRRNSLKGIMKGITQVEAPLDFKEFVEEMRVFEQRSAAAIQPTPLLMKKSKVVVLKGQKSSTGKILGFSF